MDFKGDFLKDNRLAISFKRFLVLYLEKIAPTFAIKESEPVHSF